MNVEGFEIERKFLIAFPGRDVLCRCGDVTEITQTYLVPDEDGFNERVRKRGKNDVWTYTHTRKKHLSDVRRIELEDEISEEEYSELLKKADVSKNVICKTRYCLEYEGQLFEIDVFPFWKGRAFMEIELACEEQEVRFPPDITIARELTGDRRYTNYALSDSIPDEPLYK